MNSYVLLKKEVDPSVLREGLTVPLAFHDLFYESLGRRLEHGNSADIILTVDGCRYAASLKNLNFDRKKYPNRTDILQIRYTSRSGLPALLKSVFRSTSEIAEVFLDKREKKKTHMSIDEDLKEYIVIYSTPVKGEYLVDFITKEEYGEEVRVITKMDDEEFEYYILNARDSNADIQIKYRNQKIRKMSRAVGDGLKLIYDFRCQICGEKIGEKYASHLIHAHHIDPFNVSKNNDAENIMIVCPNHHGIIHDTHPVFDRVKKEYRYPNGYREGLKINRHL